MFATAYDNDMSHPGLRMRRLSPVASINLRSAVTKGPCLFSLLYGDEILSSYTGTIS